MTWEQSHSHHLKAEIMQDNIDREIILLSLSQLMLLIIDT